MRKILAVTFAILFAVPAYAMNYRRVANKALRSSVVLRSKVTVTDGGKKKKGMYGCSGTYITDSIILTAAHCVAPVIPTDIWARDGFKSNGYPVKIIVYDTDKDLALLQGTTGHVYARLAKDIQVGDEVLNIGSPMGLEFLSSKGIVSAIDYYLFKNHLASYIITDAMINPGSSGGGAFDMQGELVGVNTRTMGLFGWQGISIAVDLRTIRVFLRESGVL